MYPTPVITCITIMYFHLFKKSVRSFNLSWFSSFLTSPDDPFTILEHQDQEIGEFYVVQ